MGVMAFPAGELIHVMNALLKLHLNAFKVVLGKCLIVAMAIHAHHLLFNPGLNAMGEGAIVVRMTVVARKGPVNRVIKSIPVNGTFRVHMFMFGPSSVGILDDKLRLSVTYQAGFVIFDVVVHLEVGGFEFYGIIRLCAKVGGCSQ